MLTKTGYGKSVLLAACIFQAIIVIVVIKIFEKHLLRSSLLEMNFYKLFVSIHSSLTFFKGEGSKF